MRPSLFLAAALLLSACVLPGSKPVPAAPGNPITGAAISVQSLDAPKEGTPKEATPKGGAALPDPVAGQVDASLDAITAAGRTEPADEAAKAKPQAPEEAAGKEAAQTDEVPPPSNQPPSNQPPVDPQSPEEARCLKSGGLWATAGDSGAKACVRRTRDAGKACSRQTQCEGLCLARSRSCAPITPMFGCNEILQADGREVTLCLD